MADDEGRTWSDPVYTGLDRACDPCLTTLADGRVALSWGRRYPEGWSRIGKEWDYERFEYPGEGYVNLSISNDGGESWNTQRIVERAGSCYSQIIEVEPDLVGPQVDRWVWRLGLSSLDG